LWVVCDANSDCDTADDEYCELQTTKRWCEARHVEDGRYWAGYGTHCYDGDSDGTVDACE
jgi:hypothetical protein